VNTDSAMKPNSFRPIPEPRWSQSFGNAANVTVNLIQPGTLYGSRRNNLDFRVAKILRYGRTRTQVGSTSLKMTHEIAGSDGMVGPSKASRHCV
jgi:hypothetical protein